MSRETLSCSAAAQPLNAECGVIACAAQDAEAEAIGAGRSS